jgi:uncharacterized membrane protein YqgA involved in biofilm formation
MQNPMKSNKLLMMWLLFGVWVLTITFTIILNRDNSILLVVSGVFASVIGWLFKLRKDEKNLGLNGVDDGQGKVQ